MPESLLLKRTKLFFMLRPSISVVRRASMAACVRRSRRFAQGARALSRIPPLFSFLPLNPCASPSVPCDPFSHHAARAPLPSPPLNPPRPAAAAASPRPRNPPRHAATATASPVDAPVAIGVPLPVSCPSADLPPPASSPSRSRLPPPIPQQDTSPRSASSTCSAHRRVASSPIHDRAWVCRGPMSSVRSTPSSPLRPSIFGNRTETASSPNLPPTHLLASPHPSALPPSPTSRAPAGSTPSRTLATRR
jgi:hypothetical protein